MNRNASHHHTLGISGGDDGFANAADNGEGAYTSATTSTVDTNHEHSFITGNMNSNNTHNHSVSINNTGGGESHENRPPYYALVYIMRLH